MDNPGSALQRVVWITGAAGGLGRGLVHTFLEQGWLVAAAGHRQSLDMQDARVLCPCMDVTDPAQVSQVAGEILARWRRVDVLINNAGITADQACWRLDEIDWEKILAVNLKGAFVCSRAVIQAMLKQGQGHIINISSFAARQGSRGQTDYAAAKAGLLGLTLSLARELGARNIQVNAVLPGVLPTRLTAKLSESQFNALVSANVLGRISTITEVAGFIAFLSSMRHVSGQIFQLDSRIAAWT